MVPGLMPNFAARGPLMPRSRRVFFGGGFYWGVVVQGGCGDDLVIVVFVTLIAMGFSFFFGPMPSCTPVAWERVIPGPLPCSIIHSRFVSRSRRAPCHCFCVLCSLHAPYSCSVAGSWSRISIRLLSVTFAPCAPSSGRSPACLCTLVSLCTLASVWWFIFGSNWTSLSTRDEGPTPSCTLVAWGGIIPWHSWFRPDCLLHQGQGSHALVHPGRWGRREGWCLSSCQVLPLVDSLCPALGGGFFSQIGSP